MPLSYTTAVEEGVCTITDVVTVQCLHPYYLYCLAVGVKIASTAC